ncbi:MAG: hypothetical protein ABJH52_08250 [Henriciella sp.]
MRLLFLLLLVFISGCQSVSNATQFAFAPKHYDAPNLMKGSDEAETEDLLIVDGTNVFLNLKNPKTDRFMKGKAFEKNSEFAEFAYAYIRVANQKCERRAADMLKGSTAQQTGFNLVTTASAVAGSALSSTNAANTASGAAAFFNSISTNAGAFQSAINGQYSANLLQAVTLERALQFAAISKQISELEADQKNGDRQAAISVLLSEYNQTCTIGRAQQSVNRTLAASQARQTQANPVTDPAPPEDQSAAPTAPEVGTETSTGETG